MKNTSLHIMDIAGEVSDYSGVQLGEKQKDMIVNRLRRRMYNLGLQTEEEYVKHYTENHKEEFKHLLSLFTTHHTFFFREFTHFEFLRDMLLPRVITEVRARADKTLKIWSAACSRGQEVFSLAIFVNAYLKENAPDLKLEICGTDVDEISVEFASNAVFLKKEVDSIPLVYQSGNFLRGTAGLEEFVRVNTELRKKCWFKYANLMDLKTWPEEKFDIIFCRNVFIYFSPADIEKVVGQMKKCLHSHGAVFLGLTESLNGISSQLKAVGPSVYASTSLIKPQDNVIQLAKAATAVKNEEVKKVLCVDDSPTVLDLMKQIFNPASGYTVAATAANGADAAELLKNNKYDLITLDIHMPKMTGLEFMQQAYKPDMPPVLVVSSVERTETTLALEMMRLGASDYIQKPSLKDFQHYKEEIHLKAKTIIGNKSQKNKKPADYSIDLKFATDNAKKAVTGSVGIFFKPEDISQVKQFIFSNKNTGVDFKMICETSPANMESVKKQLAEYGSCISDFFQQTPQKPSLFRPRVDVGVVLSSFTKEQLASLQSGSKQNTFLAEECYLQERQKLALNFDLFPRASMGYMVKKMLLEKKSKE